MRSLCFLSAAVTASAASCAFPSVCEQPAASFVRLQREHPRVQWNINGGFCGSFSLQTLMMTYGAWVSEDLVRKANIGAPCFGHGNGPNSSVCTSAKDSDCVSSVPTGCEVGPENYAETCAGLKLQCDVWDHTQPRPQAAAYKAWLKSYLIKGIPVMWVPMLKGHSNTPYGPRSCPSGGHFNHHEPVLGIGSNRNLDDAQVYDDDWIMHLSDENEHELVTYYRTFASLEDGFDMGGNCKHSDPRKSCAYPCIYDQVTYGVAVRGFERSSSRYQVSIDVDIDEEPDGRVGEKPAMMHANVTVRDLIVGAEYKLHRYQGLNSFPSVGMGNFEREVVFTAIGTTWHYADPKPFPSSGATYYIVHPASEDQVVLAI